MIYGRISENKNHQGTTFDGVLAQIVKEGARKLLQQALENEVEEVLEQFKNLKDEKNKNVVVRNGYLPNREIQTGAGSLEIQKPRLRDKRGDQKFTSSILPPYIRRSPTVEAIIPLMYLKGISTNDMCEVLETILGKNAEGLSPTNIVRLKQSWETEFEEWGKRDLSNKHYIYLWADGVYFNIRLQEDRPCVLVMLGALADGTKEIITILDGHRESKESWMEALLDLKRRGLKIAPSLAIGDGALGFWAAIEEVFPTTRHQRCWVHKTANVLDKMAKGVQSGAKKMIHEMYMADTKVRGEAVFEDFLKIYDAKYPKACACLKKDKDQLFTFYDFPAKHWLHIRTTNPIESTFATIRHRMRQTKGCGSRGATLSMVYKLMSSAETRWKKLNGSELIEKIISGVKFKDGEEVKVQEKVA